MSLSASAAAALFTAGLAVTLGGSELLTRGLGRAGAKLRFTEGMLGLLTALGADAPELSSAVIAILLGARDVGVGVVVGSNLFNLAALLGVSALSAGRIAVRRGPLVLDAAVGLTVTGLAAAGATHALAPIPTAGSIAVVLVPYVVLLALRPRHVKALPRWLRQAVALRPQDVPYESEHDVGWRRQSWWPVLVLPVALAMVVAGSLGMVQGAIALGKDWGVPSTLVGVIALAAVTGTPNLYAALHLAHRGRGTALVSEAMNSNTINLFGGMALPAVYLGAVASGRDVQDFWWLAGLTLLAVGLAGRGGLGRLSGGLIVLGYLAWAVLRVLGAG